jgi:FAD binding domain
VQASGLVTSQIDHDRDGSVDSDPAGPLDVLVHVEGLHSGPPGRVGRAGLGFDLDRGTVRITSTAENGLDRGSTSLRADVIVGADGVNSAVRSTGGFVSRVSLGSSYVRTIVRGQVSPWFEEYWTPLGSFGQAPLGGDLVYFWAAAHVAGAADAVARGDLGAFRQEWRRVLPAAGDLLERVSSFDDLLVNTVRSVACRRWFSGRLVLLGDAAHAMPPNLGQGANSALVDSLVLAEELARAPSVMDALVGYDKRRRPLTRRVRKTAELLQRLCGIERVTALRVRDSLPAGLARFPRLSEEAIRRPMARTSELSDRHPYLAMPAEPTIARVGHSGRVDCSGADLENTGRRSGIAALLGTAAPTTGRRDHHRPPGSARPDGRGPARSSCRRRSTPRPSMAWSWCFTAPLSPTSIRSTGRNSQHL